MDKNGRDLVGYGANVPVGPWPAGARLAVSLVVNYEEGSERTLAADGENEGLGEVTRDVGSGHRDLATESVYEYGSRAGVHRLLRLFDRFRVPVTFFAAAAALEQNTEVCAGIRAGNHEVCAHGWRWSEDWKLPVQEQEVRIRKAVESIGRTCGERPVGWYSRWMASEYTRELLVKEGGFLYDSDAYNDDLPYYTRVLGRDHLVVPYTLTYNDVRYVNPGLVGPSGFVDLLLRALNLLRAEGAERPRILNIGLHPRWSGQAGRADAVREFIERALEYGDVWFARRREIAERWRAAYPPSSPR